MILWRLPPSPGLTSRPLLVWVTVTSSVAASDLRLPLPPPCTRSTSMGRVKVEKVCHGNVVLRLESMVASDLHACSGISRRHKLSKGSSFERILEHVCAWFQIALQHTVL